MFQKDDKVTVISTGKAGVVTEDQAEYDDLVTVEIEGQECRIDSADLELVERGGFVFNSKIQTHSDQYQPDPSTTISTNITTTTSAMSQGDLAWVTQDQIVGLQQWWGDEWQSSLTQWLESVWPGWQGAEVDQKHQWLGAQLVYPSGYETSTATITNTNTYTTTSAMSQGDLAWVTQDQIVGLQQWWGDQWQSSLTQWLESVWPGWQGAEVDQKHQWLGAQLVPSSGYETSTVTISNTNTYTTTSAMSQGDLAWVTQDQIVGLRQWLGGEWQSSLGPWLDKSWPNWQSAEAADKRQWLDEQLAIYAGYGTSKPTVAVRDDFSWVGQRQRATFEEWWGESWEDQLSLWLSRQWPGWRDANATIRENWLNQQLQSIKATQQAKVNPANTKKREREEELQSNKRARQTEAAALKRVNQHLNDLQAKRGGRGMSANISSRADFVGYVQTLSRADQENLIQVYNSGVERSRGYDDDFISITDIRGEEKAPWWVDHWGEGAEHDPQANAEHHYALHGQESHFHYGSVGEYTQAALDFKKANSRYTLAQNRKDNVSIICRYSRSQQRGGYLVLDPNNRIVSFYPLGSSAEIEHNLGLKVDADDKTIFID